MNHHFPRTDAQSIHSRVEALYRQESRRVLATLIRLLGHFELAEEALQDAFIAAVEQWPHTGLPHNPRAWLISTGRFKAIDSLRRRSHFDASLVQMAKSVSPHRLLLWAVSYCCQVNKTYISKLWVDPIFLGWLIVFMILGVYLFFRNKYCEAVQTVLRRR